MGDERAEERKSEAERSLVLARVSGMFSCETRRRQREHR